jgi:hypothetical protein
LLFNRWCKRIWYQPKPATSHMRSDAFSETYQLLDEVDPERTLPVSPHAVMPEIGRAGDLAKLGQPLRAQYGPAVADAILYRSAAELVARVLPQREP